MIVTKNERINSMGKSTCSHSLLVVYFQSFRCYVPFYTTGRLSTPRRRSLYWPHFWKWPTSDRL